MSNKYHQIPTCLQMLPQWVVWRYEGDIIGGNPTKVPYNPLTGKKASATNPKTWVNFEAAVNAVQSPAKLYDGINFAFTDQDPYSVVDLDVSEGSKLSDIQLYIIKKLDSYTEISPSGRGAHIIVKGNVPHGRNNAKLGVEIYSKKHFFSFTGDRLNNKGVEDRATLLTELWQETGKKIVEPEAGKHLIKNPSVISDDKLITSICSSALNNDYFNCKGDFNWSEAYHSVLCAAAFYSSDEEQIKRVILNSPIVNNSPPHGKETRQARVRRLWEKEYNNACISGDNQRGDYGYLIWSTNFFIDGSRELYKKVMAQSRENINIILGEPSNGKPPRTHITPQDIYVHNKTTVETVNARKQPTPVGDPLPIPLRRANINNMNDLEVSIPPGAAGELIEEILPRTYNPSPILACWAALGFISGAVGRAYVLSDNSGINCFLLLSSVTNTGKTQHWEALVDIAQVAAPSLLQHKFGGDAISQQIIAKEGQRIPSMVLRIPDAGGWLKGILDTKNTMSNQMRGALLNIYQSAGAKKQWETPKSIRAKNDNCNDIDEFNMSLVLDTTPQNIQQFDMSDFTDGLMSRFIIVYGPDEASDKRKPKIDHNVSKSVADMFDDLQKLYTAHSRPLNVNSMGKGNGVPERIIINYENGLEEYIWEIDLEIFEVAKKVQRNELPLHYNVASRAIVNAKRVAACIAVQNRPWEPIITREIFDWALRFVHASVINTIIHFESGLMGSEESKQEECVISYIRRTVAKNPNLPYVTLRQIGQHVDRLAPFSNSRLGARHTRQKVIDDLINRGVIEKKLILTKTKPQQVYQLSTSE